MIEGGSFIRCPYCDRIVDMNAADVVYAVKVLDVPSFGQTADLLDRAGGAFFHPGCPPGRVGYAPRPRPEK